MACMEALACGAVRFPKDRNGDITSQSVITWTVFRRKYVSNAKMPRK
jgi:hypothetical protein